MLGHHSKISSSPRFTAHYTLFSPQSVLHGVLCNRLMLRLRGAHQSIEPSRFSTQGIGMTDLRFGRTNEATAFSMNTWCGILGILLPFFISFVQVVGYHPIDFFTFSNNKSLLLKIARIATYLAGDGNPISNPRPLASCGRPCPSPMPNAGPFILSTPCSLPHPSVFVLVVLCNPDAQPC